jgi:hypothetical protein
MSLELDVVCPAVPEPEQVARLVGPLMGMILRRPVVHALIDDDRDLSWTLLWDTTKTMVSAWPPGLHEWEDCWAVDVGLGCRDDLSLLLIYVTAAAIAIMSDNDVPIEKIADLVGHRTTVVTQTVCRHQLRPVIETGATAMNTILDRHVKTEPR